MGREAKMRRLRAEVRREQGHREYFEAFRAPRGSVRHERFWEAAVARARELGYAASTRALLLLRDGRCIEFAEEQVVGFDRFVQFCRAVPGWSGDDGDGAPFRIQRLDKEEAESIGLDTMVRVKWK